MTPHDRYQRLIDLKGEIKQADDLVAECERAEGDKLRALQMASEATIKQRQKRAELHDEARKLAKQASDDFLALIPEDAAAVDELIAPSVASETLGDAIMGQWQEPGPAYNSIFTEGADLHSQLLAKAEANMNGAYDEATR